MWRLLLGTMGVKSLVQGLNAVATAGFEPRTVWSEVRRRNRLATAPPNLSTHNQVLFPIVFFILTLSKPGFFCAPKTRGHIVPPPPAKTLLPFSGSIQVKFFWKLVQNESPEKTLVSVETMINGLRQDPPLIWVFGHFWLFCTMV